ncbi:MAG: hypothetical protein CVV44_06980 [Spirochaetae bacterium HGW-Spirochaetae-1]|jgi:hypothetical protein|nr:MAG: hypothetical protein CVV44_06980 [Spirochaetae bacterium HGW-Spirochaetae-1]
MIRRINYYTVIAAVLAGMFMFATAEIVAQTKVPGGVTSRIKKINTYLDNTESRLKSGSSNMNDLDRAKEELATIKKSYPDFASHKDVIAAENRISQVEKSVKAAQSGKQEKRLEQEKDTAAKDRIYEDWAGRLSQYKADSNPGSKGIFGIPTDDIESLLATNKYYEEAKSLYAEFLKTGIDKDAHFKLRQAEYDIKVSILNYEASRDRIPALASEKLEEGIKWMKERKGEARPQSLERNQRNNIDLYVSNANRLFPNTDRVNKLNARKAELDKMLEDADKSILENRRMKPAQYRGSDSGELTNMAKSIVLKANPGASILKVNVTSKEWTRESVVEWTDSTRSALQGRITDGIYAQVSAKIGSECFLFTLFLNKNTIGGKQKPLTGHVMYKERILEKNAR